MEMEIWACVHVKGQYFEHYCNIGCSNSSADIFVLNGKTFHDSCCFLLSNAGVPIFGTNSTVDVELTLKYLKIL